VFFYAYLCTVKAVAARKTGPLTARQTNLRKSIEEMNKQLIKKFKKYLESKSAFYIYLKMYRDTTYWIHFAVRPKDNRRKILFDCR
jgi:Ni,Fe-hydrogenase III component G